MSTVCWRLAFLVCVLSLAPSSAVAAPSDHSSPVGLWRTIDDKTGQPRSVVRIYEQNGELFASVVKGLTPGDQGRTCSKCTDERKNQPLLGMVIIRRMKPVDGEYRGGDILDPDNGSVYRCKLRLEDNGRTLKVRGYLGVSLFGRSQTWEREH